MGATISLAKSILSSDIVHIDQVNKKEDNNFICTCGGRLMAIKSKLRRKDWHFRHKPTLTITNCRNTLLHDYAVQLIKKNSEIILTSRYKLNYSFVDTEVWLEDLYRSDVAVKCKDEIIHFEVVVHNDLDGEKANYYADNKIRCVKINLSDPELLKASQEKIKNEVLFEHHNKQLLGWLDKEDDVFEESPKMGKFRLHPIVIIGFLFLAIYWILNKFLKNNKRQHRY